MGKWTLKIWAQLFLKIPQTFRFFQGVRLLPILPLKKVEQERSSKGKESIHILFAKFSIFTKMTIIWPKNIYFKARLNFNSSANVGPLTTNDGALELWHHREFIFGYLSGGRRNNYKNNNLVRSKQTVPSVAPKLFLVLPRALSNNPNLFLES